MCVCVCVCVCTDVCMCVQACVSMCADICVHDAPHLSLSVYVGCHGDLQTLQQQSGEYYWRNQFNMKHNMHSARTGPPDIFTSVLVSELKFPFLFSTLSRPLAYFNASTCMYMAAAEIKLS